MLVTISFTKHAFRVVKWVTFPTEVADFLPVRFGILVETREAVPIIKVIYPKPLDP